MYFLYFDTYLQQFTARKWCYLVIYNTCVKDAPTIEKGIMDLKGKSVRAKEATKIV